MDSCTILLSKSGIPRGLLVDFPGLGIKILLTGLKENVPSLRELLRFCREVRLVPSAVEPEGPAVSAP